MDSRRRRGGEFSTIGNWAHGEKKGIGKTGCKEDRGEGKQQQQQR
jgi:hypothetical protein